ncbi:MAG: radical SAM family heme chaperone HemW [Coriobacteriales bacterium]|jgi:oxygen-independent coproporphyrinogen-3 oxidase|nr:radical SAM family heme chaperone HemW [Coriobacteriales bacterium]
MSGGSAPSGDQTRLTLKPPQALYFHIPFCAQRCRYCDFLTEVVSLDDPRLDNYLYSLIGTIRNASSLGSLSSIETIYVGGGTPSYFGHGRLVELAYTLSLFMDFSKLREFTVEANPDSFSLTLARDLYALGVNRISLGVQSFNDAELSALGRVHDVATAVRAIEAAQSRFENVSLDLICGIPGQTPASWLDSVSKAIDLGVKHISVYALQLEPNTVLTADVVAGRVELADEDTQATMLSLAAEHLEQAGFERYETASYAQAGFECRHNIAYWTGVPYLGLGRGAASMLSFYDGRRLRSTDLDQTDSILAVIQSVVLGKPLDEVLCRKTQSGELLTKEQALVEDLMLGMRLSRGLSKDCLATATKMVPGVAATFAELVDLDLVRDKGTSLVPTQKGWLLGNELFSRIWALAKPLS